MPGTRSAEELSAPLGGVGTGHLVFTRGAAHLKIRVDATMDDLFRARFEGKAPLIEVASGTVSVKYRPSLHHTTGEVMLAGRIPWSIECRFGMSDVDADLEDLRLVRWEVTAGASKIKARLPRPTGTVAIRIGAGASNVELTRPEGVPLRVRIGAGASKLTVDDFTGTGKIAWRSPDYETAEGRYDIEIGAGASNVTIRA